ncbi:tRNA S(4)U 4-thiouridine synthase (former ThiI) [Methanosarcina thermophila CHTI-55]|uniref:tRNA S(4)U 4-thiouridine synthase (Former ThiI) n=2 Tax=Methanosarcina thermophila TaxID=2210 RepID=A0A0E3NFE9_METTE|nr:tRNA S(4)U 4-thiouridine synthase (former ThiI) [Methanosarcina thermophila TM-1]AKB16782.1 tRNA S(4)U 4-thiouridine synthase (former ThiI) [Methanosarcina thermophila CHTI-55]
MKKTKGSQKIVQGIAAMLDSRDIPYSQIRREWGRIFIETTAARLR